MYVRDGIAYAGEKTPMLKVTDVCPLDNYNLLICFNTGETRIFDFTPFLSNPVFAPLTDMRVFRNVYIDRDILVWNDGNIDISPEILYEYSINAEESFN